MARCCNMTLQYGRIFFYLRPCPTRFWRPLFLLSSRCEVSSCDVQPMELSWPHLHLQWSSRMYRIWPPDSMQYTTDCLSWSSYKFKGFDINTEGRKWKNDFLSKMYSLRIQPYVNIVTAQESLFQKGFLIIGLDCSEEQHFTLHCVCKFTECVVHFVPYLQNLHEPAPSTPYPIPKGLYFLTLLLVSVMRVIHRKIRHARYLYIKRNVENVWGARYTLGARYLSKDTVMMEFRG